MAENNEWIDEVARNRGCFRSVVGHDVDECAYTDRQLCNDPGEYEDLLIAALDMGLSAEEIADIVLGATS